MTVLLCEEIMVDPGSDNDVLFAFDPIKSDLAPLDVVADMSVLVN